MIDLTWWIKLDIEPGGSRWRVVYWVANPPPDSGMPTEKCPALLVFQGPYSQWLAKEMAEKLVTSWDISGDAWEVHESSL